MIRRGGIFSGFGADAAGSQVLAGPCQALCLEDPANAGDQQKVSLCTNACMANPSPGTLAAMCPAGPNQELCSGKYHQLAVAHCTARMATEGQFTPEEAKLCASEFLAGKEWKKGTTGGKIVTADGTVKAGFLGLTMNQWLIVAGGLALVAVFSGAFAVKKSRKAKSNRRGGKRRARRNGRRVIRRGRRNFRRGRRVSRRR
jgi:hypothetical protein